MNHLVVHVPGVNLYSRGKMRTLSATWQKMIVLFPTWLTISGYHGVGVEIRLKSIILFINKILLLVEK